VEKTKVIYQVLYMEKRYNKHQSCIRSCGKCCYLDSAIGLYQSKWWQGQDVGLMIRLGEANATFGRLGKMGHRPVKRYLYEVCLYESLHCSTCTIIMYYYTDLKHLLYILFCILMILLMSARMLNYYHLQTVLTHSNMARILTNYPSVLTKFS